MCYQSNVQNNNQKIQQTVYNQINLLLKRSDLSSTSREVLDGSARDVYSDNDRTTPIPQTDFVIFRPLDNPIRSVA